MVKKLKKEKETKRFPLRIPQDYYEKLERINSITHLSINSLILEMIREGIKNKLKKLEE